MGGSGSVIRPDHFYPLYYIPNPDIDDADVYRSRRSWEMIDKGSSPVFVELKDRAGFEHSTALAWFYTTFYDRLFDVCPSSKPLFKNSRKVQGEALAGMLSIALSLLKNPAALIEPLTRLAARHANYGVLTHHYGMVGDVLFWTLRQCLGDAFDADTKLSWVKIFSLMLKVIIPVAVESERKIFEDRLRVALVSEGIMPMGEKAESPPAEVSPPERVNGDLFRRLRSNFEDI